MGSHLALLCLLLNLVKRVDVLQKKMKNCIYYSSLRGQPSIAEVFSDHDGMIDANHLASALGIDDEEVPTTSELCSQLVPRGMCQTQTNRIETRST